MKAFRRWSERLGLATAPLFGERDSGFESAEHHVMLDGGRGSFALTEVEGAASPPPRSLAWSADLPHHVVLAGNTAIVTRWDSPDDTRLYAVRVEERLEDFYYFLLRDRVKTRRTVVDHSVTLFRRLRGLLDLKNLPQSAAVDLFLLELVALSKPEVSRDLVVDHPEQLLPQISGEARDAVAKLGAEFVEFGLDFASLYAAGTGELRLLPALAVRHAGGAIFQEAHFELLHGGQGDLFSGAAPAAVRELSRGGVQFTPPALARMLAEQVLATLGSPTPAITVLDPSCGSGAFLYEVLRTLGRDGYSGRIHLVGRDVSPHAIAMAQFVLDRAREDWASLTVTVDLAVADSLDEAAIWRTADVVLMNPPFVAWGDMTSRQRDQMAAVMGPYAAGRPDYCMAFVECALASGRPGVVVGTLLPASVLGLEGSSEWRRSLAERAEVPLVCSFGDYGLFRYALVQVGAMVLRERNRGSYTAQTRAVWTAETTEATGNALRALRRLGARHSPDEGDGWSIDVVPGSAPPGVNWRPRPWRLRRVLERIGDTLRTTVGDVFSVTEGVRTGARDVFILTRATLLALPKDEHPYFRPVAEGRNIRSGHIHQGLYIFYPTAAELPPIETEAELAKRLPNYYERTLKPARPELMIRPAVRNRRTGRGEVPWWELNRPRKEFERGPYPKIVSAYFGQRGSFAFDEIGEFVVVQGHAWLPRGASRHARARQQQSPCEWSTAVQRAYVALLNSRPFEALLAEFCPRVQGGQFNLSQRFVKRIPMPDLPALMMDDTDAARLLEHLAEIQPSQLHESEAGAAVDEVIAKLFGVPLDDWPLV